MAGGSPASCLDTNPAYVYTLGRKEGTNDGSGAWQSG